MPAVHSWHSSYFFLSWYLPDGQWKQLVWPVHGPNLPTSQSVHSSELVGWNLPMAQSVHPNDPATENVPSSQAVHSTALYTAENWPAAQGVQTEYAAFLKDPGAQAGVGAAVGAGVGLAVGCAVGIAVGFAVGAGVGLKVGSGVGMVVGAGVGFAVGLAVGDGVGIA